MHIKNLLFLVASFSLIVEISSCQVQTVTNGTRVLLVTAQGTATVPANVAIVTLGVQITAPTAQQAQQEAASRASNVIDALQARNVSELETVTIALIPLRDSQGNGTGFTGINTLQFQTTPQTVGEIIDEAVAAGATTINGITFVASDEDFRLAQDQAIQMAIENARRQAGVGLGQLQVSSQQAVINAMVINSPPMPVPFTALAQDVSLQATPVIPGQQDVTATVTLEFRF